MGVILVTGSMDAKTLKQQIAARFGAGLAGCEDKRPRWSDFDLNPHAAHLRPEAASLRDAAVLLPIVDRPELTLLFTQRTDHLKSHAGQISFPGGRREAGDSSPVDTALRETEEEVGIRAEEISLMGAMDIYETRTGFRVTPVIGLVTPDFTLQPDDNEVAEVFEVPLRFLLDPANHQRHTRDYRGVTYYFHAIPYGDYYIWGATASMLKNFYGELLGKGNG